MLIEFYNIIVCIVPIIVIGALFTADIDESHREQVIMHDAVKKLFFYGKCNNEAICEKNRISLGEKHKIYIRKNTSPFRNKNEEVYYAGLDELYDELEEASKGSSFK